MLSASGIMKGLNVACTVFDSIRVLKSFYCSAVNYISLKLQRKLNRHVGDKTYTRFVVTLPKTAVKKAGFHKGQNLHTMTKKHSIRLFS